MEKHILIRYGELSLKKSNRNQFTQRIIQHIKTALAHFPNLVFQNKGLRYYIVLNDHDPEEIIPILKKIPGIYSFSVVYRCESDLESIKNAALEIMQQELAKGKRTFKVETNRAYKQFPLTSLEISQTVASYLFKSLPDLKADMRHPDFTLFLDVRDEGTYIYTEVILGMGGFPAHIQGKGLLMVSGGIDSVVAGYLAIKKGVEIEAVHFASPPYTSDNALQKVVDLLEQLAPYTLNGTILLHVVPFTTLQQLIYQYVREDYGITIMRRMMYRISERLAKKIQAEIIINGESIGQVASQTLESMSVINSVVTMPVIRPLAMMDKEEIINIARDIGTYDISIRPFEDCCTVFVPRHPQIKPRLHVAEKEEQNFDFEKSVEEAMKRIETIVLSTKQHYQVVGPIDLF
ncbi:MAG TPA: tRNA uracil 4-sulfurtransferase ThiI [Bacilli bacterium]|jgi:thiamine biosynthesis protein ThiI|nr:MAG: putative tRNA sulfurtransferase [Tenericutes bacterium ADurb.Bin140]HON64015.1 tRNA uracil 4-sulfurtransferase ThiI [Bacilli bacterium]HOR95458.1 tRNA uracil 4-sulfurtransferase ThiI [Bacilli bacterium]HPD12229.1 tRNA uracil 4-sulfurtransferase ThiI [Bacilli bacterium]HPK57914.1 tRNA uracil 4-sulfurtransferase ThiI [Bacilli bacterium]